MKTVKDYINELDADELVRTYFQKYSRKLSEYYYEVKAAEDDDEMDEEHIVHLKETSVFDYAEETYSALYDYIEYLKTIEITEAEDGSQGIIYAINDLNERCSRTIRTELLMKDELLDDMENCEHYDYFYTRFSEILGFLVADNELTQKSIYDVIADVMWWASYTGYRQEGLEKSLEIFDEEKNPIVGSFDSFEELMKSLNGEDWVDKSYKEDEESEKLRKEASEASYRYYKYSVMKERKLIVEAIKAEG